MAANGKRRPSEPARASGGAGRRIPRIEIVSAGASVGEAAAIVAALEQLLADTAPVAAGSGPPASPWQRAALEEGISARQVTGAAWGHAPLRHSQNG